MCYCLLTKSHFIKVHVSPCARTIKPVRIKCELELSVTPGNNRGKYHLRNLFSKTHKTILRKPVFTSIIKILMIVIINNDSPVLLALISSVSFFIVQNCLKIFVSLYTQFGPYDFYI